MIDREPDEQRPEQRTQRDREALQAYVASAVFHGAERSNEVLDGDVDEHQGGAEHDGGEIKHVEPGKQPGNDEPHGQSARPQHDRPVSTEAVTSLAGLHRQQHRAQSVERDEYANRRGRSFELDGIERHQHAAAHEAHPVEHPEKKNQVDNHRGGERSAAKIAAGYGEKLYSNVSVTTSPRSAIFRTKGTSMQIRNVGVVSPGDMGQAIAGRIKESGLNVHAALDGRSERTKTLARAAGLNDCGSMEKLVATCDLVISVINPGEALTVARQVAAAMKKTGRKIAFADLNAVSPQT